MRHIAVVFLLALFVAGCSASVQVDNPSKSELKQNQSADRVTQNINNSSGQARVNPANN